MRQEDGHWNGVNYATFFDLHHQQVQPLIHLNLTEIVQGRKII